MSAFQTLSRRLPILSATRGSLSLTAARVSVLPQTQARYTHYSSHHENDPEKLEGHKQDSLKDQKDGKGQWKEELASDSEAFIKSERSEIKATGEEIEKLQKEGNKLLKESGLQR